MRRALVAIFLSSYGLGNIVFPNVDFRYLPDIYRSCKAEDPDMSGLDFVADHLLALPDVFACFEHDEDDNKNEKPHKPIHNASAFHHVVLLERPEELKFTQQHWDICSVTHSRFKDQHFPAGFSTKVLRPPIV